MQCHQAFFLRRIARLTELGEQRPASAACDFDGREALPTSNLQSGQRTIVVLIVQLPARGGCRHFVGDLGGRHHLAGNCSIDPVDGGRLMP
jgi:hypothetical protein